MTNVITVISNKGIWQLFDHRLTVQGQPVDDMSLKQVYLKCLNGKAFISYAGLGKVKNTHISDWVRKLIRGADRTLDDHLALIADAATKKIAPLSKAMGLAHTFSVGGFKDGEPVLSVVTNRIKVKGADLIGDKFEILNWKIAEKSRPNFAIISVEGSGATHLSSDKEGKLIQGLIKRRARKPTLGQDVAAALAYLNKRVSGLDKRVSPHCVVSYLKDPDAGPQRTFWGWDQKTDKPMFRDIAGVHDIFEIMKALLPDTRDHLTAVLEAMKRGEKPELEISTEKLNEELRKGDFSPTDKFQ